MLQIGVRSGVKDKNNSKIIKNKYTVTMKSKETAIRDELKNDGEERN